MRHKTVGEQMLDAASIVSQTLDPIGVEESKTKFK